MKVSHPNSRRARHAPRRRQRAKRCATPSARASRSQSSASSPSASAARARRTGSAETRSARTAASEAARSSSRSTAKPVGCATPRPKRRRPELTRVAEPDVAPARARPAASAASTQGDRRLGRAPLRGAEPVHARASVSDRNTGAKIAVHAQATGHPALAECRPAPRSRLMYTARRCCATSSSSPAPSTGSRTSSCSCRCRSRWPAARTSTRWCSRAGLFSFCLGRVRRVRFNDAQDAERDRAHEEKRHRPIAVGPDQQAGGLRLVGAAGDAPVGAGVQHAARERAAAVRAVSGDQHRLQPRAPSTWRCSTCSCSSAHVRAARAARLRAARVAAVELAAALLVRARAVHLARQAPRRPGEGSRRRAPARRCRATTRASSTRRSASRRA